MLLYLLFAVAAYADVCETSTCFVCKAMPGCDWYGFSCLATNNSLVTTLSINATATCSMCQAGSCVDCQNQTGCSWFSSSIPGIPGKCDVNTSSTTTYNVVNTCPTCQNYDSTGCQACVNANCSWFSLPGGLNAKCREASPSFAYSQTPSDSCDAGNRCAGIESCSTCQTTNVTTGANSSACAWYTSKSPTFYDNKCDDNKPGVIDNSLYTQAVAGTCPACAGTSCTTCKAESGCKWVAVSEGLGTAFGECLPTATATPRAKTEIPTCPAECSLHSCISCIANDKCNWFSGSSTIDDSCDLATDGTLQHPFQKTVYPSNSNPTCGTCLADRCYECNNLSGCGWYVQKELGITIRQGCYSNTNFPAGRTLRPNSDSKCDGVPSSSAHVAASIGVMVVLAMFA